MKKYAVMVVAVMLVGIMASVASSGVVYGEPGWDNEGEGRSEETAWEINSPEVLAKMRDDVNSRKFDSVRYYKLTSDIDLTGYGSWVPIGGGQTIRTDSWSSQPENTFFGHFDGNGHTVQVSIGWGDARNVGLFGWVDDGGSIKNLSVSGNVSSKPSSVRLHYVGGIASRLWNGTIENCNFDGTVTATGSSIIHDESTYVGGIVGYAGGDEITITGCKVGSMSATSISSAEGKYGYEGGIMGRLDDDNSSSMVTDNYANVTLSGNCDNSGAIYGERLGNNGTVENNTTGNSNNGDNSDNNGGNNGDTGGGNGGGGNGDNSGGGEENDSGNNNGGNNNGGNNDNNGDNPGDNDGNSGNGSITINGSFPDGTVNTAYQASVTVSGGTSPYEWTYSGTPPTGTTLSLGDSTETAYLTGTPTTAGTYTFSLTVTDNNSRETSKSFTVTISGSSGSNGGGGGGGGGCNSGLAVLAFALSALITLRKSRN